MIEQSSINRHQAECAKLQRTLNVQIEIFIDRIRQEHPKFSGIVATWEACFRMALRGECTEEICAAKLMAIFKAEKINEK